MAETSVCKWCKDGNVPEFSPHTKSYIHRLPRLDRACESQFSWNHKNLEMKRDVRAAIAKETQYE